MAATYTVGDGKTYSTIQAGIDAIPGNLSGEGIQTVEVYSKSGGYSEYPDIRTGFSNPSSSNYIHVKSMVPHNGNRGGGVVVDVGRTDAATHVLLSQYVRLSGFCITASSFQSSVNNRILGAYQATYGTGVWIYDNMIYDCAGADNQILYAIDIGGPNARVFNNVISNLGAPTGADAYGIIFSEAATSGNESICANNTFLDCDWYGIYNLPTNKNYWKIENNYSSDHSMKDYYSNAAGTGGTFQYNISSDTSAGAANNNLSSKASVNQFVDNDKTDFDVHLLGTADCNRNGSNLSSYFTTDFEGNVRGAWNTGADEYVTYEYLEAQLNGTSSLSAALSSKVPIVGQLNGVSSLSGFLSADVALQAALNAQSDIVAFLSAKVPIQAQLDAVSFLAGDLLRKIGLFADLSGQSYLAGTLTADVPLAGAMNASASMDAFLSAHVPLQAQLDAVSSIEAHIHLTVALVADLLGQSSLSGFLKSHVPIQASLDGQSSLAGDLSVFVFMQAILNGVSTLEGRLIANRKLQALLSGESELEGELIAARLLDALLSGSSDIAARLRVLGEPEQISWLGRIVPVNSWKGIIR